MSVTASERSRVEPGRVLYYIWGSGDDKSERGVTWGGIIHKGARERSRVEPGRVNV